MASRWWITSIRTMFSRNSQRYNSVAASEKVSWELYGGPSAEPALVPSLIFTVLPLRAATGAVGHHLQDSTHTSFGVVTTGFTIDRVKLEGSAFNGHEPNEERWSIQPAALDSWSVRGQCCPQPRLGGAIQHGHLDHP